MPFADLVLVYFGNGFVILLGFDAGVSLCFVVSSDFLTVFLLRWGVCGAYRLFGGLVVC